MRHTILIALLSIVVGSSHLFAYTQTLPKGVWQVNVRNETKDISQVGAETFNDNDIDQPNGDVHFERLENYRAKNISSLQPLIKLGVLDPNTQLAESARIGKTFVSLAYGFTDKLTLSLNIPWVNKSVHYTDEYRSQLIFIDNNVTNVTVKPEFAKGVGWGDMTLGMKYQFNPALAFGASYSGGIFKTGKDEYAIKARDGYEELTTGKVSAEYGFALYSDFKIAGQPFGLTSGYMIIDNGYEKFFENAYKTNPGDELGFNLETFFNMTDTVRLDLNLIYLHTFKDMEYNKEKHKLVYIDDTAVTSVLYGVKLTYQPAIFFNTFIGVTSPLSNTAAIGSYEYPGRLHTDAVWNVGMNFYFRDFL